MRKQWLYVCVATIFLLNSCKGIAQEVTLVSDGISTYKIVLPEVPSDLEIRSASTLQANIKQVTGAELPVVRGSAGSSPAIYIGHTKKGDHLHPDRLSAEGYLLQTDGKDLVIMGGSGKGLIYGVYTFLQRYAGCRKISESPVTYTHMSTLKIPAVKEGEKPQFEYRESYYPASADPQYLEWNKLQRFEDLWGPHTWGHTFDKLVPGREYFKSHPEYFALVKGRRQPTQLCLSNEDVFKIVVAELKKRMADNPDALYWSVSPNDDIGYCECDKCKPVDDAQATPAGSVVRFVNRVAAEFPDKKITTLAYGYTHRAPKTLKPASNVYVFLSDIDAFRDKPLTEEGSAAAFRNDLKAWSALTPNIFVWDYVTEFTNYLAPFPNFNTLQPNMQYLKENGVKGVFVQGSGDTYSEFAELRSYLIACLLNDSKADVKKETTRFLTDYYGAGAAKYIQEYITLLQTKMQESHHKLDIYGNPVNEWAAYLSPQLIDQYSDIFDKAEAAAGSNTTYLDRILKIRLPLDYTVYQQARFFGIEKFGIFVQEGGKWVIRPKLQDKIKRFVANCKKAGVTELSEGGDNPDQYQAEWDAIFKAGVTPTKAIGASVSLQYPFVEDYPAKGTRTLVDGTPGYGDFSYNWLCFYGNPLVATIDLGKPETVKTLKMHFLDDPRHWIFLPPTIKIEVSEDGSKYRTLDALTSPAMEEHYERTIKEYTTQNKTAAPVRYIKVTATNLTALPEWRFKEGKKPMIACDEVFVQ